MKSYCPDLGHWQVGGGSSEIWHKNPCLALKSGCAPALSSAGPAVNLMLSIQDAHKVEKTVFYQATIAKTKSFFLKCEDSINISCVHMTHIVFFADVPHFSSWVFPSFLVAETLPGPHTDWCCSPHYAGLSPAEVSVCCMNSSECWRQTPAARFSAATRLNSD